MSSHQAHGYVVPDAVSGHLGLELVNTLAGWGDAQPREYLSCDAALLAWALDVGLVAEFAPAGFGRSVGEATVRAVGLRAALREVVLADAQTGAVCGSVAASWDVLTGEIASAHRVATLRPAPGGALWSLLPMNQPGAQSNPALRALAAAALAAEELLRSPLLNQVAACPGQGCGWVFADPRGRRRWCSMAVCGNRAKAKRFAVRRRADGGEPSRRSLTDSGSAADVRGQ